MPGRGNRYGGEWPAVRERHLREFPWCAVCQAMGQRVPAVDVDHIVRCKPTSALFWQRSNHRSLCKTHHASKSGREAHGLPEKMGCDVMGFPRDPKHPWNL
jgi:5-methylcytosine-specific restriction protein A